jgi:hypothetical protein
MPNHVVFEGPELVLAWFGNQHGLMSDVSEVILQ